MKDRIETWKRAFEEDDQGVLPTLIDFSWNYAAYTTIAKIVEHSPETEDGRKNLNYMMLNLLASGYWQSAALAIRRLVDGGKLKGKKGVNSLRAIVNDIKDCRNSLTRKVFLEEIHKQAYDYELVRERYWHFVQSQPPGQATWIPKELQYELSENLHTEFDFLSGVAARNRTPEDIVQEGIFDKLDARLSSLDAIADHATIHFAHSATKESREGRVLSNWGPNEAKESLQLLAQTAEFIGRWFIGSGIGHILPTPQFDQFEFLDRPLFMGATELLQEDWDAFDQEVSRWPFVKNNEL